MDASFRISIKGSHDLERLVTALGTCHELLPGSLRLTEGVDILAEQLIAECRDKDVLRVDHAQTPGGLIALFRCLWKHPLAQPAPCDLRLEAKLESDPTAGICLFMEIPAAGKMPRWVDAKVNGAPAARRRVAAAYRSICRSAGLTLEQV